MSSYCGVRPLSAVVNSSWSWLLRMEGQQIPGPGQSLRRSLVASHKDRDHFVSDFFGCHSATGIGVAGSYQSRQEIFWLAVSAIEDPSLRAIPK